MSDKPVRLPWWFWPAYLLAMLTASAASYAIYLTLTKWVTP